MVEILALALVCSYIETLIPFSIGIPGIKLGLTNIIVVLMIYCVGAKEAFAVSIFRIILVGFMFGNAFSIIYSLAGGMLSFFAMYLLIRFKVLKCVSVSVIGGICHNIGQIIIATIVVPANIDLDIDVNTAAADYTLQELLEHPAFRSKAMHCLKEIDVPIESMGLGVRALNALKNAEIYKLSEIIPIYLLSSVHLPSKNCSKAAKPSLISFGSLLLISE